MYNKQISKSMNRGIILGILSFPILFFVQGQMWASLLLAFGLALLSYFGLKEEDIDNYMILFVFYCIIMAFLLIFFRWYTLPIYVIGVFTVIYVLKKVKIMKDEGRLR